MMMMMMMMMMMTMMMMAVKDRHQQLACILYRLYMTNKCTLSPLLKETRRRQEPVVDDNKSASEGDSD